MKVGIVVDYSPPLQTVYDIVAQFQTANPVILALTRLDAIPERNNKAGFSQVELPPNIPIYFMWEDNALKNLFTNLKFFKLRSFEKAIKDHNINLLHAQYAHLGFEVLALKKKFNIPLIVHCRGQDVYRIDKDRAKKLNSVFNQADILLSNCNYMKDHLINIGCPKNRIIVFYGGVNLSLFHYVDRESAENDKIKIIMCARFAEKKGFQYGIKAFSECLKSHKNIELRIIGDGPKKKELTNLIKTLNIEESVKMVGKLPPAEVAKEMHQGHILLMPYATPSSGDKEGAPHVLKEGSATGLPIISTYHAGVPEVVKDNVSGYLVNEHDVGMLAKKLNQLIENKSTRLDFGKKGRKIAEKFDAKKQIIKLEKIYQDLIDSAKAKSNTMIGERK
jgi:colanic acid/amylovoran biosynthesis glycosyltransferase